ncbi:hypothetical protein DSO57_1023110 [Entomophthora muscae]|uniref:Uncharacterized protein n=1 Tax=Entomophthora muscae TaxID=34485 RepID=A0ACC2U2E2_9FUNG|nr:hypothetical protein DSO57_1023110 [Entomophthora muscae]
MISRFINKKYSSKDFKMSLESYYTYDGFDFPILCIKYEIMRHIREKIALCGSGIEGCCAADYCFDITKYFGEITNRGPWSYTSIETLCVDPDYASLD